MTDIKKWRKLKVDVVWNDWQLFFSEMYYDGQWWQLNIGPFYFSYSKNGLPYLFQDKE